MTHAHYSDPERDELRPIEPAEAAAFKLGILSEQVRASLTEPDETAFANPCVACKGALDLHFRRRSSYASTDSERTGQKVRRISIYPARECDHGCKAMHTDCVDRDAALKLWG